MNVGEAIERMCEVRDRYNKTLCSLPPKTRERSDYNNDIDAFLLAIEALEKQLPKKPDADNDWIPVEERLPEDNPDSDYYESVIVTLLDGRCAPGVYRNGDKEWWVEAEDGGKKYTFESDVIAWRPLPEPYKQN